MSEQFGIPEIAEFAEHHEDERIRILYRRYQQSRNKSAGWCSHGVELRKALQHLVNYIDSTGDESLGRSHAFRNAFKLLYGRFPDERDPPTFCGIPIISGDE